MTDIPLALSPDGISLDWVDPSVLAQPLDNTDDLQTYVLMLLGTDRVAPQLQYGLQNYQRRGCWQDTYVGEFGSLFWLGVEENQWAGGSKIAQIQSWAQLALQTVYDEGLIVSPAQIDVSWVGDEAVQVDIDLIAADNTTRKITYVLGTS